MIEFKGFPKIGRLFRDVVITEKIDGTNAAVGIVTPDAYGGDYYGVPWTFVKNEHGETTHLVYAQSRTRMITPNSDNHGFARWVWDNAEYLVENLGEGLHFGEWWGSGINRGYDLPKGEKRFSLFNTHRWGYITFDLPSLDSVPVLYEGPFSTYEVKRVMADLTLDGSKVAPGFPAPEGVVVYHRHANAMFKATLVNDKQPKSVTG